MSKLSKTTIEMTRDRVAETAKLITSAELVSLYVDQGNISARIPGSEMIAITPTGIVKGNLRPDDIVIIDMDGKLVEGRYAPSAEKNMHLHVYEKRPDVNAVIHTHSPFASSFAIACKPIPCAGVEIAAIMGGEIPLAEYALPGTKELGRNALEALGDRKVVLLANHGVLSVGSTLDEAATMAALAEENAKLVMFSYMIGGAKPIPEDELTKLREMYKRVQETRGEDRSPSRIN